MLTIPTEPIGSIPRPAEDCGFAPFSDDRSTSRDIAFARLRARVAGTALAARRLEGA
jgi:5-methyltetrahydropteroyltriglutamate--homocysteine methyltransferase